MRNYEIMFILSTQLTEEEKQTGIKYVEDTLKAAGADPVTTEILGDKKLAYPINKKENGFAVVRVLGKDMNPTHIMNMLSLLQKSQVNLDQLKPLQQLMN